MSSKNVPLYLPQELNKQIAEAAIALDLPQSQCMRLSIQFGLPELLKRLSLEKKLQKLPKQSKRAWPAEKLRGTDLDQPCTNFEELDENII